MGNLARTVPLAAAQEVVEQLQKALASAAQTVAASGSVRRALPLVGDVDVIAVGEFAAIRDALGPFGVMPQPERPWVLSGMCGGIGFDVVTVEAQSYDFEK